MTTRELQELRAALERLRDALTQAVRALDEAQQTGSSEDSEYVALGEPFGPDLQSQRLWRMFRQYTTRN